MAAPKHNVVIMESTMNPAREGIIVNYVETKRSVVGNVELANWASDAFDGEWFCMKWTKTDQYDANSQYWAYSTDNDNGCWIEFSVDGVWNFILFATV